MHCNECKGHVASRKQDFKLNGQNLISKAIAKDMLTATARVHPHVPGRPVTMTMHVFIRPQGQVRCKDSPVNYKQSQSIQKHTS